MTVDHPVTLGMLVQDKMIPSFMDMNPMVFLTGAVTHPVAQGHTAMDPEVVDTRLGDEDLEVVEVGQIAS